MDTEEIKEIALCYAEMLERSIRKMKGNSTDLRVAAMFIDSYAGACDVLSSMYDDDIDIKPLV